MFLGLILLIAVLAIVFPKALIRFWIKLYELMFNFCVQKHKGLKYGFILFGAILILISIYLFFQKVMNVDIVGIFILLVISICLMFFSSYFSQSLIDYFKMALSFYEKHEKKLVLFTRLIGGLCVFIIIFLNLFNGQIWPKI